MKEIKVKLDHNSYSIFTANSDLSGLKKILVNEYFNKKMLVIIDENVEKFHSQKIMNIFSNDNFRFLFYRLKSGEKSKSYTELNNIYSFMLANNFGRDSLIIAFGGGVTGDLAGYAASTFMRGIQLIHVPTTLLAMVDSSIGGKTGINFDKKKNMIGTFYQPELVFINTEFLSTLPKGEVTSGIGEILKYAFLADKEFFKYVNKNILAIYDFVPAILEHIIYTSVLIKAAVVSGDERESGLRQILNLGHTFAHAFESILNFRIKHGEAVVAGLYAASFLSNRIGILPDKKLSESVALLNKIKISKKISYINLENAYSIMQSDKKNRGNKIQFVLLSGIGNIVPGMEASKEDVFYSLNKTKETLAAL